MSASVNLSGVGPADMCLPEVALQLTSALDAALSQIAAEYPGQRVAVVTHNGTIKSAAKVIVGAPAESIFHIDVSPCSITTVSIWPSDGLRALRTLNEQGHLH